MVEHFKGCTIQSAFSNSTHSNSDKHVDEINDSEEQFDTRNWLRNKYVEQIDQMNDTDKQVDAITDFSDERVDAIIYSKQLVVTRSNPKSDSSSDQKVATHTTNRKIRPKILISRFVPKIIPVVIRTSNPPITADCDGRTRHIETEPDSSPGGKHH